MIPQGFAEGIAGIEPAPRLATTIQGFNLNGEALEGTWDTVGTLRLATVALRSRTLGKLEFGKTYGMATPTYADPFLATYGSPYTYLALPAAGNRRSTAQSFRATTAASKPAASSGVGIELNDKDDEFERF